MAIVLLVIGLVCMASLFIGAWYVDNYCVVDHLITEQGEFVFGMLVTFSLIPIAFAIVLGGIPCVWNQAKMEELDEKNF
jgi:hypothetical protein